MTDKEFSLKIPKLMVEAVQKLGTLEFYHALLRNFLTILPKCDAYILKMGRNHAPQMLHFEGGGLACMELYLSGIYRIDPVYQLCRKGPQDNFCRLSDFTNDGPEYQRYFAFVTGGGVCENLAALYSLPSGDTIVLAWDLEEECGRVSHETLVWLREFYEISSVLHEQHLRHLAVNPDVRILSADSTLPWAILNSSYELLHQSENWHEQGGPDLMAYANAHGLGSGLIRMASGEWSAGRFPSSTQDNARLWFVRLERPTETQAPASFDEAFSQFADEAWRPSETEVAKLSLQGYDNATIAKKLNIGHQVVKNYKAALYQKAGISSEREFFTQFLKFVLTD
ncbi:helix-turn-helix transcriptional regulator (plasmid) [Pseudohalocynthiibacter aestuariivivens]|nr:helix-turn-helix transcriptional regulator [Pseudohalocynthiibacter aestuariivivens]QIE48198.1 helix-turn-helix transcriptional regulator [Pseudohalocynthiibacter aestuariivivens]